ncbi:MAG: Lin1244/Lin1753 domain-containing protein [Bacteroidota bacterium]
MAKDTFWFKHDYNARNDEKILELRSLHGAESYGIYWMIVETMADNDNGGINKKLLGGLSGGYGVAKGRLQEIIECCLEIELFYEKDGFYYSGRMLRHKKEREVYSVKGKEGAEKRWGGYRGANAEQRRGEKIIGISFENEFAVLSDGTKQKLGKSQLFRLGQNDLKPKDILKGQII